MELKPTHYTNRKGGLWIEWDRGAISDGLLARITPTNCVYLNGRYVHSLIFDDGRIWNVEGGWRQQTEKEPEDMTALRDEFAKIALGAVISVNPRMSVPPTAENWRTLTRNCYTIADLMIEARSRK